MWKSFVRHIGIAVWLTVQAASSAAQENFTGKGESIDLTTAVVKTMEKNPQLLSFGYELRAQDGRVLQAGLAPNPELSFTLENVLGSGEFDGTDNAEATLSIAWILERGVRQKRVEAARAGISLLNVEADIKRFDAAAETARVFFTCLFYQTHMRGAEDAVAVAEESLKAVRKRVNAGKAPQAELARAKAELARMDLNREDIEHELLSAVHRLAAQWGDTAPGFARVEGDLMRLPVAESFSALKNRIDQNPDFARYLSQQRLDESELRLAQAKRKSNWRVSAGVRRLETTEDEALVANITLPLALKNPNQGGIAEAQARLSRSQADTVAERIRIETTLFVIHQELQHSLHRVATYRNDVIPQLEQALAETRRAYERGRYSFFEWSTVQKDLLEARHALVEASVDAHMKVIEIERLTGVRAAQPAVTPREQP